MTRAPKKATVHPQAPPMLRGFMGSLSKVAPGLAARIAADLFMRPLRPKPRDREIQWTADAEPVTLPTRFGDLAGWSWGEGPVVILLHGWNGRGSQMGLLARTIAQNGFRAVAFDAPAHGRSPGRRTNLLNHSAALVDVANNMDKLHGIVGHSFGALAISYRAAELPALQKLAMISPPAETKFYSRMFIDAIGASDGVHEAMTKIYERRYSITWEDLTVENLAPALDTPLLVVHDRTDRQAPFSHGERTRDTWARARLHETDSLGHLRILRNEEVARVIADFMTEGST